MNLNYDKIKKRIESGGNQWTAYSDLFMVLSCVFILLYVVTSLRDGAGSHRSAIELKEKEREIASLKAQLQTYDVLKDRYLMSKAPQSDRQVYENLMSNIHLLEQRADRERKELLAKADEKGKKAQGLNQYQSILKSIITANMLAQSRIKHRDEVISKTRSTLNELNKDISEKETLIAKNNLEIEVTKRHLQKRIKELTKAHKNRKILTKEFESRIKGLKEESEHKINVLSAQTEQFSVDLEIAQKELNEKKQDNIRLSKTIVEKMEDYHQGIVALKTAHQKEINNDKIEFARELKKVKLSADEKLKREQAFSKKIRIKNELYQKKLSKLEQDYQATQIEKDKVSQELQETKQTYTAEIQKLKKSHNNEITIAKANFKQSLKKEKLTSREKLRRQEAFNREIKKKNTEYETKLKALNKQYMTVSKQINHRKNLAKKIIENFKRAGIEASVDSETGEVTIHFGQNYFGTDSHKLTGGMVQILDNLVPVYAKSLFEDEEIARNIGFVEIIGFSSPTYRGKYVNPKTLSKSARQAVNYNLDLSYNRAKSIFTHVFDTTKIKYEHQKKLFSLVKVGGRSFLASDELIKPHRIPASMSSQEFCEQFNCGKSQKVIIKFYLKDKVGD